MGCQSRGCEFEPQLGQHSFHRLTKVIVTCVIRLSPMGCLTVYVEKQPVAWKDCCVDYCCEKARKHIGELAAVIWLKNCWKRHLTPPQTINLILFKKNSNTISWSSLMLCDQKILNTTLGFPTFWHIYSRQPFKHCNKEKLLFIMTTFENWSFHHN